MKLEGKKALITGGAIGIGRAIAKLFVEEGCRIAIADIDSNKGKETKQELARLGKAKPLFIKTDVSNAKQVKQMAEEVTAEFQTVDILVNNAAIWRPGTVVSLKEDTWDKVIDTNLKSIYIVSKYIFPNMQENGGGTVVNLASVAGVVGAPQAAAYSASKGGVVNLTRNMALDFANDGIRVNAICPGLVDTAQGEQVVGYYKPDEDPEVAKNSWHPIGRVGYPDDIAKAALYFASDQSSFATGSIFVIDGGLSAE